MKLAAAVLVLVLPFLVSFRAQSQDNAPSAYHVKAQFAGDLGLLSLGAGRAFFHEKLEADLFLGYLPEKVGGDRIVTSAIKATYIPVKTIQLKALDWQPLRTGLQIGYTFGDEYFAFEPRDKYPKSYYGFSTALHLYYFIGGQVNLTRVNKLSKLGVYYEVGSNAEYIISYIQNPVYLSPGKIFHLALGIRRKF